MTLLRGLAVVVVALLSVVDFSESRVNVFEVTTKQVFDIAVLRNQKRPVIAYFTKPSCGGGICARIQTELEELARQNQDTLNLAIIDLEKKPEFKDLFEIGRIPTTRAYFKGNIEDQVQGPSMVQINKMIDRILEK